MKFVALLLLSSSVSFAAGEHQHNHSPYAGEESREIKSLSTADIEQIQAGQGWGLAKPAELNGVPGPLHILELADDINLSATQREQIEAIYQQMKADAILAGEQYLALERELDQGFIEQSFDAESLQAKLDQVAGARAQLRFVHLNAHLQSLPILSKHQVMMYNKLRGYGGDPCASVPAGHNEKMWKMHNGCN